MSPNTRESADVVVIGSGAGGAPLALTLAEAGARVVVLEKGPYYTVRDFSHDEIALTLRDFWTPYPSDDPHTVMKGDDAQARRTREGWTAQCVGGATVHMSGFTYRLKDSDLRLATLTGGIAEADLADWPLSLEELAPFYDLVEAKIGVSGVAGVNPFEAPRRPYPLPPLPEHAAAGLVDEAARSLGLHPFPTARAVLSRPYGGRPPCTECGFCGDYGCENGSKSSVLATLLPAAEATGRCEIRPQCQATRIGVDAEGKVSGVEYVGRDGKPRSIAARVVCLAASAIESARLLLLSETSRFPHGLGNGSGLVGKNLTFSTYGRAVSVFDRHAVAERAGKAGMDLPFLQRSVQDDYWMKDAGAACPKGGTYAFMVRQPSPINDAVFLMKELDWKVWGPPLKEALRKRFQDELAIDVELFGEFLPWKGCFVDLDPKVKDGRGLPVARIHVKHHPASHATSTRMVQRASEILKAMRPAPQKVVAWSWGSANYPLQHGTCRFGRDPSTSVLDPDCQSHEVKNLY
ncbi:MAG: GMC family oxidoreductase, partial [Deltaproteobacteria bacterium]|nr:GMC family oxidoreductase [Deltaproteobacteria bacterium]